MKKFIPALCILFCCANFYSLHAQKTAQQYYKEAVNLRKNNKNELAAKTVMNSYIAESGNAKYAALLGDALWFGSYHSLAVIAYNRALDLDPSNADALRMRTSSYKYRGKDAEGVAIKTYPANVYDQEDLFQELLMAVYLQEKLGPLSWTQLYEAANSSKYVIGKRNRSDQWDEFKYDTKTKFPIGAASISHLEAAAVIYYLNKMQAKETPFSLQDSVMKYITKKTKQNFYAGAILYNYYSSVPTVKIKELEKYCSKACEGALENVSKEVTGMNEEPPQYRTYSFNRRLPNLYNGWMDEPVKVIVKNGKKLITPKEIHDEACREAILMLGTIIKKKGKSYYLDKYDCNAGYVMLLEPATGGSFPAQLKRYDLKHLLEFEQTSKRVSPQYCEKCNGYGYIYKNIKTGVLYKQGYVTTWRQNSVDHLMRIKNQNNTKLVDFSQKEYDMYGCQICHGLGYVY